MRVSETRKGLVSGRERRGGLEIKHRHSLTLVKNTVDFFLNNKTLKRFFFCLFYFLLFFLAK